VVGAGQELEHSVGLEVVVRVTGVLAEGEAWLSRTGGIGGLSGSDIELSGPTEGQDWDEQYQQVATHNHCSTHEQELLALKNLCKYSDDVTTRAYNCWQGIVTNLVKRKS